MRNLTFNYVHWTNVAKCENIHFRVSSRYISTNFNEIKWNGKSNCCTFHPYILPPSIEEGSRIFSAYNLHCIAFWKIRASHVSLNRKMSFSAPEFSQWCPDYIPISTTVLLYYILVDSYSCLKRVFPVFISAWTFMCRKPNYDLVHWLFWLTLT